MNGEQLRMFMPAHELHALPSTEVHPTEPAAWRTHEQLWADKQHENGPLVSDVDSVNLTQSVAKHGVQSPVRLDYSDGGAKIDAGHHRIQAAYDADPESLVPVVHKQRRV